MHLCTTPFNPNSLDNKGSCWILKDFYCSVTMLRELGFAPYPIQLIFSRKNNIIIHDYMALICCEVDDTSHEIFVSEVLSLQYIYSNYFANIVIRRRAHWNGKRKL